MTPKLFELRPDRKLLNPDFNGYKLSLDKIPVLKKEFDTSVDRVLPNNEQYSLLHAKLFGLHNHLYTDHFDKQSAVYFIDKLWNVRKISIDQITGRLNDIKTVWEIPQRNERKSGQYNVSVCFTSENIAVLSDGAGMLHIVNTGNRSENTTWQSLFSDEVLDSDKGFIIQDAIFKKNENSENELHCVLIHIEPGDNSDRFSTIVSWITLNEMSDNKWGEVSMRVLKASGGFYYCALESNCKYIYIASEKPFKFILDSENPIIDTKKAATLEVAKIYTWLQSEDDIIIRFNTNSNCDKKDFGISVESTSILVKYKEITLLQGELNHRVDAELTTWNIANGEILEITVTKSENGLMWQDFVPGDETGEQIIDPNIVAEVHQRLAHLCSETEIIPAETGPAFSTQQIEECDFEGDNTAILERFSSTSHEVTHRSNLGSHQVVMTVKLAANIPPSIVIRHDVDACIWSPQEQTGENWSLKHDGSLLAFGYVQASKQQRKFSSCSPNLNYSIICESMRHAFIYRQNKAVTSGELRNRRNGQRVGTVAEQQVISLPDDEILGLSATNEILYLLTETFVLALKVECTEI